MQRWEYLTKTRKRNSSTSKWSDNLDWLPELGAEGWELVSVVTRSESRAWSGFTTEELWVFKRPVA